ncbi:phytoene/squalene synthase family protein [Planctomicrobium sp. SH668]|uniref:phytoene/squalene synthase family protein n=1 Tax=Planctomicrobium sp. SH668 TaxID=3448126 RepID=UPI003F5C3CF8
MSLKEAQRFCETLAKKSGSNFFIAFRTLPADMYRQMCVLYAFMRHTDDLSDDESLTIEERKSQLGFWRSELLRALAGETVTHPILIAIADLSRARHISSEDLCEVIAGVESDLTPRRFQTFSELDQYCYQVAGVVGLCCLKIWGFDENAPRRPAIACGTAFQLTNVLRDLKEDGQRGRIYLPEEDLVRAKYPADELLKQTINPAFRDLMQFQVQRAWSHFHEAIVLQQYLSPAGRRVFLAFFELYSSILKQIEVANYDVYSNRIRLSRWKKGRIALSCILRLNQALPKLPEISGSEHFKTTLETASH